MIVAAGLKPRPTKTTMSEVLLNRFTFVERLVHWLVGGSFLVLLATGLALSYPSLFWLTTIVGGGPAARALHPWVGVVFGGGMIAMIGLWIRDMFLDAEDRTWLGAVGHYATHQRDRVPPAGKYNAGQKIFFWLQGGLAVAFVVTGAPLWFPGAFGSSLLAVCRLIHYAATLGGGLLLVVHVYLGTVAYPGTARGMIDGQVTARWARLHHPRWHEEQTR